METILTIGGDSYLLPKSEDVSKVLEMLQGVTKVRNKTIYGPDGELCYDEQFYRTAEVLEPRPLQFRVELLHDNNVMSQKAFAELEAETKKRIAALPPAPAKELAERS